ncbi:MAG: hypothetical protein ACI8S6_000526 [Myxococcota bacterium]
MKSKPRCIRDSVALVTAILWMVLSSTAFAQDLSSFLSPGPLSEHHAEVSGITQCTACHTAGTGVDPAKCLDCHDHTAEQVRTGRGFHADKTENCESCHADHRGETFAMVRLEEESFDHSTTGYPLEGAHAEASCLDCHEPEGWVGVDPTCLTCHDDPHGQAQSTRDLLPTCDNCHSDFDWDALPLPRMIFDHDASADADFALEGEHSGVNCESCHEDWRFVPVDHDDCEDCHRDIHNNQFDPRQCEDCHTVHVPDFALRDFDHRTTDYPLEGQHKKASCEGCHGDGEAAQYVNLSFGRCDDCHTDVHNGQFQPRDCSSCHTLQLPGFQLIDFDHDQFDFPLNGAHEDVSCDDCHGEGPAATFADLPFDDCATCHDDFHEGQFAPARCDSCHIDGTWETESFDHDRTDYPLTGAHIDVTCDDCHTVDGEEVFRGIEHETCADCHDIMVPHEGGFAAETCGDCHETGAWDLITFAHFDETGFPLEDSHDLACAECHTEPAHDGQVSECASCHDRPEGHFEGACDDCHLPTDWWEGTLGAGGHDVTGFPLRNLHTLASCRDCHAEGHASRSAGTECIDCHRGDDPHRNLVGNTCSDCHGDHGWSRVRFAHASTGYPLRGNHALAPCLDCHANGFVGTPDECSRCHQAERPNNALHRDPATAVCESCHRPYDWDFVLSNPHGGL